LRQRPMPRWRGSVNSYSCAGSGRRPRGCS
jgi:hypothetical protein